MSKKQRAFSLEAVVQSVVLLLVILAMCGVFLPIVLSDFPFRITTWTWILIPLILSLVLFGIVKRGLEALRAGKSKRDAGTDDDVSSERSENSDTPGRRV